MAAIVILQQDLRLRDNPALFYAAEEGRPLLVVYLKEKRLGIGNLWWLERSLRSLEESLHPVTLLYYDGESDALLHSLEASQFMRISSLCCLRSIKRS